MKGLTDSICFETSSFRGVFSQPILEACRILPSSRPSSKSGKPELCMPSHLHLEYTETLQCWSELVNRRGAFGKGCAVFAPPSLRSQVADGNRGELSRWARPQIWPRGLYRGTLQFVTEPVALSAKITRDGPNRRAPAKEPGDSEAVGATLNSIAVSCASHSRTNGTLGQEALTLFAVNS